MAEKTGEGGCAGTPYSLASRCLGEWLDHPQDDAEGYRRDTFREAAQEEIDFLKGLLP